MTEQLFAKTEQQQIFDLVFKQINEAKKNGWNLLLPSMAISPSPESLFVPYLEKVEIEIGPNSKDYYKASGSNMFRLHAVALNRIALAGELKWNNVDTGYAKDHDGSLIFRAVGGVVNSAGNVHQESGYYALNLDDIRDDLIDQYTEKAKKDKKGQDYIDYCVNRDYRQKRAYRMQLCETCAKNRVIRKIFNVKNEYTMEQLKLPFIVLKFSIYMDYKDPEVRRMVLGMKIQAALGIYGINPNQLGMGAVDLSIPAPKNMDPWDPDSDPNLNPDALIPDDIPLTEEDPIDTPETDFLNADDTGKILTLRELSKRTGIPIDEVRLDPKNRGKWHDLFKFFMSRLPDSPNDNIPV